MQVKFLASNLEFSIFGYFANGHTIFPPPFSSNKSHVQFFYDREATGKITRREDDPFLAR